MIEPKLKLFHQLEGHNLKIDNMRTDNAGENTKLAKRAHSSDWKMKIKFELTARHTPQQNHLAELGFVTIMNRAGAMMITANVPPHDQHKFAKTCIQTATKLDSLQVIALNRVKQTRHYHCFGKQPTFAYHLRIWGEARVVALANKMDPKLKDRGHTCMFVG